MNVLEVRGAAKSFGDTPALRGAELELHRGEWLALLGPNGAGKTTLVRAVSGRVRLDHGDITLLGRSLNGHPASRETRRELGTVPQEIALYPLLTARENLIAFGRLHGLNGELLRQRVEWALTFTDLGERSSEPIKRFSGGMKRRLNIACGVLHRPRVILLDEPTVGVDPQSRQRIWEMLAELRAAGASLVLTTHQLDEAQKVCDRIVIIDHGKVIASGTVEELVAQTIGPRRLVTLTLVNPACAEQLRDSFTVDGATLRCPVLDVAAELPALLTRVQAAGCKIDDVHIEAPSLHAVFLHLTGRELRE